MKIFTFLKYLVRVANWAGVLSRLFNSSNLVIFCMFKWLRFYSFIWRIITVLSSSGSLSSLMSISSPSMAVLLRKAYCLRKRSFLTFSCLSSKECEFSFESAVSFLTVYFGDKLLYFCRDGSCSVVVDFSKSRRMSLPESE